MLVRVVFHILILNKHVTLQLLIKVFEFICGKFVSVKHEAKSGEWINMTPGNGFERTGGEKRNSLLVHLRINTLQVVLDLSHNKFDSLPGNDGNQNSLKSVYIPCGTSLNQPFRKCIVSDNDGLFVFLNKINFL